MIGVTSSPAPGRLQDATQGRTPREGQQRQNRGSYPSPAGQARAREREWAGHIGRARNQSRAPPVKPSNYPQGGLPGQCPNGATLKKTVGLRRPTVARSTAFLNGPSPIPTRLSSLARRRAGGLPAGRAKKRKKGWQDPGIEQRWQVRRASPPGSVASPFLLPTFSPGPGDWTQPERHPQRASSKGRSRARYRGTAVSGSSAASYSRVT